MKKGVIIILGILFVILIAVIIILNNGSPNNSNSDTTPSGNAGEGSVEIKGFAFSPATLTVKIGDSVTWTNMDSAPHTVTSDSGSELDSPTLSKGEIYSHTFNSAGTYNYYCTLHPSMKGKIIVE